MLCSSNAPLGRDALSQGGHRTVNTDQKEEKNINQKKEEQQQQQQMLATTVTTTNSDDTPPNNTNEFPTQLKTMTPQHAWLSSPPDPVKLHQQLESISSSGQHQPQQAPIIIVGDRASPFSQRTLFALQERNIGYEFREATAAQKTLDSTATNPTEYLPFIIYQSRVVAGGSVNLIQFLEEAFPHQQPRLLSDDLIERSRERLWSDYIRQYAVPLFVRALRARVDSYRGDPSATANLGKVLDTYADACIGPFFSGHRLSLPDILIAPFIHQTRLTGFPRPASEVSRLIDSSAGRKYQEYASRLLDCRSLRDTIPKDEVPIQRLEGQMKAMASRLVPSTIPRLPPELVSQIIDEIKDYELAETLGVAHHVPETTPWKESATPLDRAILSGSLNRVVDAYTNGKHRIMSSSGARVMIRFGYIYLLEYLLSVEPAQLHRLCDYLLPEIASAYDRVNVLEWALKGEFGLPKHLPETPLNEATRNGHVNTLEWWKRSGLRLKIGNVMDFASMEPTTISLDWWAKSGLEGKYTKVSLYHPSLHGNLKVLDWWLESKLPLMYDKEVLIGATKQCRLESLDWWLRSGLAVYFNFFEIEEAIEDCYDQFKQGSIKDWWKLRGLNYRDGSASDWTEVRLLGRHP